MTAAARSVVDVALVVAGRRENHPLCIASPFSSRCFLVTCLPTESTLLMRLQCPRGVFFFGELSHQQTVSHSSKNTVLLFFHPWCCRRFSSGARFGWKILGSFRLRRWLFGVDWLMGGRTYGRMQTCVWRSGQGRNYLAKFRMFAVPALLVVRDLWNLGTVAVWRWVSLVGFRLNWVLICAKVCVSDRLLVYFDVFHFCVSNFKFVSRNSSNLEQYMPSVQRQFIVGYLFPSLW